jgi:hypothetical protein
VARFFIRAAARLFGFAQYAAFVRPAICVLFEMRRQSFEMPGGSGGCALKSVTDAGNAADGEKRQTDERKYAGRRCCFNLPNR